MRIKTVLFSIALVACNAQSGANSEGEATNAESAKSETTLRANALKPGGTPESHQQATKSLLKSAGLKELSEKSLELILSMQMQNPKMATHQAEIRTFFEKHLGWKALEPDLVEIYQEAFTEQELLEVSAFYDTPTGKKLVQQMPELQKKQAMMANSKIQAHMSEFLSLMGGEANSQNPHAPHTLPAPQAPPGPKHP